MEGPFHMNTPRGCISGKYQGRGWEPLMTARRSVAARFMAIVPVLLSCLAWADAKAKADPGKGQESTYEPMVLPVDYLQRTSWLWEFGDERSQESGGVFFSITRGPFSEKPPSPYDAWPTVLVKLPEGWRTVDFQREFPRYLWTHAASAPGKGYFWGFLEHAVEEAGSELSLVMSIDGGRTWTHRRLPVPRECLQPG
ncbi:uncharacterized protein STAUR_1555 [Stigmatella aurantiaca DW4/3-1]|uniref:Uncharacterized protein n=1 Tax=Stigmatella aurantiaca (strain DW4/3-1) TaxID=378806 RepID=E3FNT5_STIAD|nr:uncharacterized protein STAUR_1555 [Stigmatella aurantiaca DW4/3-1]